MLAKYEMAGPRKEIEQCDTLRYEWHLLQALASKVSNSLHELQAPFQASLVNDVSVFKTDSADFYRRYAEVSDMLLQFLC